MASLVSVHWLLVERLVDPGTYKAVVLGTVAVYIAGNVAQRAIAAKPAAAPEA